MGRQTVQLFWLNQQRNDMRKKVRVGVMSSHPQISEAVQLALLNVKCDGTKGLLERFNRMGNVLASTADARLTAPFSGWQLAKAPLSVSTVWGAHCDRRLNHGTTSQQLTGAGKSSDRPMWATDIFLACQEVDHFALEARRTRGGGHIW